MPCTAEGYPKPKIKWNKGSTEEDITSLGRAYQRGRNNELYISSVQLEDEGLYTCFATNQFGKISATVQLTVTGTCQFKFHYMFTIF